jgi:hypothetical protein
MALLKRNWLLLLLACCLLAATSFAVYRCHATPAKAAKASIVVDGATPAADATSPWTDPYTIGSIIAAVISAAGIILKAIPKRDVAAVADAVVNLRDTLKNGGPMSPSAEVLGDELASLVRMDGVQGPAFELAMRVAAEKLLKKYTITVKP